MRTLSLFVLTIAIALATTACHESGTRALPTGAGSVTLDATGGTITASANSQLSGVMIDVPAGALSGPVNFSFDKGSSIGTSLTDRDVVSPVIDINVDAPGNIVNAITIRIPVDLPAGATIDDVELWKIPTGGSDLEPVIITTRSSAGSYVEAAVTSFSRFWASRVRPTAVTTPSIVSIAPASGPIAGGLPFAIVGNNLNNGTLEVFFDGVAATNVTALNNTQATGVVPAGSAAGKVDVVVSNSAGSGTLTDGYEYTAHAVAIASITPDTGDVAGGTSVSIAGSGFEVANTTVTVVFGLLPASNVSVVSDTEITCDTPAGSAGAVNVTVAINEGLNLIGTDTLANGFTYAIPDTVVSVTPATGDEAGGTSVTIVGTNFPDPATVTFGGVAATNVMWVNDTTITCDTPAGTAGAVDVQVTGTGYDQTLTDGFTYEAAAAEVGTWTQLAAGPGARTSPGVGSVIGFLVVFGGNDGNNDLNDTWVYDPFGASWTEASTTGAPSARTRAHVAGREVGAPPNNEKRVVIWGGQDASFNALGDGAVYNQNFDSWTTMSSTNAPSARWNAAIVELSGSQVMIWGGRDGTGRLGDGAIYDISSDTWTTVSTTNAPTARTGMTAVWDDTNTVYFFGGEDDTGNVGDFYAFDANANSWTEITATGAPSARKDTGGGRIWDATNYPDGAIFLWGGESQAAGGPEADGAIYDIATASWEAITTTNAPAALSEPAVWRGGTGVIVWGGADFSANPTTFSNEGKVFRQSSKTWETITTTNAPGGRLGHHALYVGKFLIWGGSDANNLLNDLWELDLN